MPSAAPLEDDMKSIDQVRASHNRATASRFHAAPKVSVPRTRKFMVRVHTACTAIGTHSQRDSATVFARLRCRERIRRPPAFVFPDRQLRVVALQARRPTWRASKDHAALDRVDHRSHIENVSIHGDHYCGCTELSGYSHSSLSVQDNCVCLDEPHHGPRHRPITAASSRCTNLRRGS